LVGGITRNRSGNMREWTKKRQKQQKVTQHHPHDKSVGHERYYGAEKTPKNELEMAKLTKQRDH